MLFLRVGTLQKVVIGPVVAVGDGFTPITNLDITTADQAVAILHDNGTIIDIKALAYTFAAIANAPGYYHLTLQSGVTNTVGHLTIAINDASLCLPVKEDFTTLHVNSYDAIFKNPVTGFGSNGLVNVGSWQGTQVTLSINNKPDINVDEWADVPLGTTNPLPDAAPDTNNGIVTGDGSVTFTAGVGNRPAVDAVAISGDTTAADNLELATENAAAGRIASDLTHIHGAPLTETSGQLAGRFVNFFDQASATFSVATALADFKATSVTVSDKTGFKLASDGLALVTSWTVGITGSLSGSVGSVSGAVGSVTGAVGSVAAAVTTDSASRTASKADVSALAQTGADGDTLETLSDQIDGITPSDPAATADAVWDELSSEHVIAGSFGKFLDAAVSSVSGSAGAGSQSETLTIKDNSGNPISGAEVWVSTDEAGTNVVAGTLNTDDFGQVTFLLDPGTYYLWADDAGHRFSPNPQQIVVS